LGARRPPLCPGAPLFLLLRHLSQLCQYAAHGKRLAQLRRPVEIAGLRDEAPNPSVPGKGGEEQPGAAGAVEWGEVLPEGGANDALFALRVAE
jgi:hypothetical protein